MHRFGHPPADHPGRAEHAPGDRLMDVTNRADDQAIAVIEGKRRDVGRPRGFLSHGPILPG